MEVLDGEGLMGFEGFYLSARSGLQTEILSSMVLGCSLGCDDEKVPRRFV